MSYKDVLKIFKLERELSDDESALLNTLRTMSDADRELLAETLGPPVKVKVKAGTTRKIEKCLAGGCNLTRRAVVHKDANARGYHRFLSADENNEDYCWFAIPSLNGKVCGADINNPIHHDPVIETYHGFQPTQSKASSKSKRGLELAEKVKGATGKTVPNRCIASLPNGAGVCGLGPEDVLHHDQSYGNFHPFSLSSPAPPALGQSSTNGDEVSSETGSGAVSGAAGG